MVGHLLYLRSAPDDTPITRVRIRVRVSVRGRGRGRGRVRVTFYTFGVPLAILLAYPPR